MVREYKGSHSGEHGDGLVRSEFHEAMFGSPHRARLRGGQGRLRPRRACSTPARSCGRPRWTTAACSASSRTIGRCRSPTALDWSEWGGFAGAVEMCNNNGACRGARRRRHVPVLPRHRRRAASDARPRQHPAPGAVGPARPRRARRRGDARDDGAVRLVQGLQARMPDRRRHGADEDRVPAPLPPRPRAFGARPAGRLSAALCALCRAAGAAAQSAQPGAVLGAARRAASSGSAPRARCRGGPRGPIAALIRPRAGANPPPLAGERSPRGRAARRHLQPLFRAGECARRRARARPAPAIASSAPTPSAAGRCAAAAPFSPPASSTRRARRRGACSTRSPPMSRAGTPIVGLEPSCLLTLRDEFPAMLPGADTKALAGQAQLFEEFVDDRARGRPLRAAAAADAGRAPRCCTAIATRRPSPPSAPRSRRCS